MAARKAKALETPTDQANINQLGFFLDGWADMVEGGGNKAEQVKAEIFNSLQARDMPQITTSYKQGFVNLTMKERRNYLLSETHPGATTAIYIAQHGKDLYASWRTFIKPVLNRTLLLIMGGIALLFAFSQARGNFFVSEQSVFFMVLVAVILAESILVAIPGALLHRDPFVYFFIQPSWFDAEDITAMGLSAHYSVIRALDKSGIDVSKLRLKQTFKGGRKGADV